MPADRTDRQGCLLKKCKRPADGVFTALFYVVENSAKEQKSAENKQNPSKQQKSGHTIDYSNSPWLYTAGNTASTGTAVPTRDFPTAEHRQGTGPGARAPPSKVAASRKGAPPRTAVTRPATNTPPERDDERKGETTKKERRRIGTLRGTSETTN